METVSKGASQTEDIFNFNGKDGGRQLSNAMGSVILFLGGCWQVLWSPISAQQYFMFHFTGEYAQSALAAINSLKIDHNITLISADKSRPNDVLDTKEYKDATKYDVLTSDHTPKQTSVIQSHCTDSCKRTSFP